MVPKPSQVTGPFKFQNIVQPAWSHNPLVARDPSSGEILIAHIGCGTIAAGRSPQNCTAQHRNNVSDHRPGQHRNTQTTSDLPPCECSSGVGSCQTLQVMRSASPSGPFVDTTVAWPLTNTSAWPSELSNPTLLIGETPDHPTLLGFNGNLAPPNNHGPTSHPGILVSASDSWRGPYVLANRSTGDGRGAVHYLEDHGYAEDSVLYVPHADVGCTLMCVLDAMHRADGVC